MLMLLPLIILLQLTTPSHQRFAKLPVPSTPRVAECAIAESEVGYRLADLPSDARAQLIGAFDDGFAEVGSAFNPTDVNYYDAPSRRFIRAYHKRDKWMIWYEHGGRGYHYHGLGMRKWPQSTSIKIDRTAKYVGGDDSLCAGSKAYFDGASISEDM